MKHAFIMDPLEKVKPWKDTTYFLMLAAAQRGHRVCCVEQRALWLAHDRLRATVQWLEVNDNHDQPFTLLEKTECGLDEMDLVWIRPDPPFDRRYLYTTLLLDNLPPTTRVLNRPSGIRNWNEKLAALQFPKFTPPTVVSNDAQTIAEFARQQGRITLKPIDGFGGKGIVFFEHGESRQPIKQATHNGEHWIIAQAYLPAARDGDKRILLLNGEPLGAILRVHADGVELNNLDAGATAHPTTITRQDAKICAAVKPGLLEQGVFFAGIDIIGNQLIEVNVTSPTGLQELCRFSGEDHHHRVVKGSEHLI